MTKVPNSRRNLDDAIRRVAGFDAGYVRARTVIANAIVGQMLPDGVVKGGSALKLRFGDAGTRFTADLDVARGSALADYVGKLDERLAEGWCGFTGKLVECRPAKPKGVPSHYVMQPFDVKLSYLGKSWLTVSLEIGHDEIGDADEVEMGLAPDVAELFGKVGLPQPGPVPLMPLHHQVAQKFHALTESGSERAHDLVDLQTIIANTRLDLAKTNETCKRLFSYRRAQPWPSKVVKGEGWDGLYSGRADGLPVMQDVDDAVEWANALVDSITSAGS